VPVETQSHKNYFYLSLHKKTTEDKEPGGEKAQPWTLRKIRDQAVLRGPRGLGLINSGEERSKIENSKLVMPGAKGAVGEGGWRRVSPVLGSNPSPVPENRMSQYPTLPGTQRFPRIMRISVLKPDSPPDKPGWLDTVY
jgi:hypothetical protein